MVNIPDDYTGEITEERIRVDTDKRPLKQVSNFTYLGAIFIKDNKSINEVRNGLDKAYAMVEFECDMNEQTDD